jgi:ribosomal protein S8
MVSLSSFLVLVNQAVAAKKSVVFVPRTRVVEKISLFLEVRGYFSTVVLYPSVIRIGFRYSLNKAPFQRLLLVSKSSKRVYNNSRAKVSGSFLLTNSDFGLVIRQTADAVGGKVLFRII